MIFQGLPIEHLSQLSQLAIAQSYGKGDVIFHQGEAGKRLIYSKVLPIANHF
jgi:CRP/FNR family transcriptional regulator